MREKYVIKEEKLSTYKATRSYISEHHTYEYVYDSKKDAEAAMRLFADSVEHAYKVLQNISVRLVDEIDEKVLVSRCISSLGSGICETRFTLMER